MPLQRNVSFMLISPNTNIENIRYSEIKYSINNGSVCSEHMTYLLVEFARFSNITAQWLDWINWFLNEHFYLNFVDKSQKYWHKSLIFLKKN